jgi:hypothetical protein
VTEGSLRLMAARAGRANTMPLTTMGCTTAVAPAFSAGGVQDERAGREQPAGRLRR